MEACFDRSVIRSDFFNAYAETCRTQPSKWDKAESNPQRITTPVTSSEKSQTAEPGKSHWILRLCEAIAEALEDDALPPDFYNALVDAMDIASNAAQDNPTEARILLPVALARVTGRTPRPAVKQTAESAPVVDAESHIENFSVSLAGLLKNVSLPKEIRDKLIDAADEIINHDEGISTESHIKANLADALKRIAAKELDRLGENK